MKFQAILLCATLVLSACASSQETRSGDVDNAAGVEAADTNEEKSSKETMAPEKTTTRDVDKDREEPVEEMAMPAPTPKREVAPPSPKPPLAPGVVAPKDTKKVEKKKKKDTKRTSRIKATPNKKTVEDKTDTTTDALRKRPAR